MIPSASDLNYFLEIATTLNLSRAAERLGVSQPSMTLSLKRLEESVGTPVFLRSKKGVSLTPAGRALLTKVRSLLQDWDQIQAKAVSSHRELRGVFNVGCHPSVALYTLPQALSEIIPEYPELELSFLHDLSRKITEAVISLRCDLGIVVNPVHHPDLIIRKICEDEVTFWQSAKALKVPQDVLICDPNLLQSQDLIKKLKKAGFEFQRKIETTNLELVAELTAAGCGIGILPTRVAQKAKMGTLIRKKNGPVFKDEISVIYRVENKSLAAIQVLTQAIEKALKAP